MRLLYLPHAPLSPGQSHLAEQRLVLKPDSPDFFELSRPQQCQVLRLALQRPYFAISNVVTHPRPPSRNPPPPRSGSSAGLGKAKQGADADGGATNGWGCVAGVAAATEAVAAAWRRARAAVGTAVGKAPRGCG
jgi:hypothetical protein